MRWIGKLHLRLRSLLRRAEVERELDDELRHHLERQVESNLAAGMTPDEARYSALREFGGAEQRREECRDARGLLLVDGLSQDLRFALRTMGKTPGFTTIAVASLALGIGANTAIFTFVNAALLKPLPYPHAERLVALLELQPEGKGTTLVHPRRYVEWRDRARSFEALAIAQPIPVNTQGPEGAEQVSGLWTTPELFRVFGVSPFVGRVFTDQEAFDRSAVRGQEAARAPVVVLGHGYWQRRFGSANDILGKTIPIGRGSAVVIGVMPAGFRVATFSVDVYLPLPLNRSRPEAVGSRSFQCYGLLRPDVSLDAARAEMAVLAAQSRREHPADEGWGVTVLGLRDHLVRDNRLVLLVLLGVVVFVLLIACANLAGLLLARGVGRRSELALRASLGASRFRLVRQLLVESIVLSALGGALGLLLGSWASRALVFLARDAVAFGQMADVRLDGRVLGFTVALSFLTAILFGLAPAWQVSRFEPRGALGERGRSGSDTPGQERLRSVLVVGEVALALVLMTGSGLLLRTLSHLLQVELGFEPERVLTMRMLMAGDAARRARLVESVLDRVETLPEVRAAGTIQFLPLAGWTNNGPFRFVGEPEPAVPEDMESDVSTVSRGYFAAMGIPVLRGRPFERRDRMGSPRVALVNRAFVDKYCRDEDPLGRSIIGDWADPAPTEIVGVVGDVRHNGLAAEPRPTVFLAQAQVPGYITYLVLRSEAEPERLATAIRREIRGVDPAQPVTAIQPMRHYVSTALARPRLQAVLLGAFAALALALSAVGLYGLVAYAVHRRTHEIGVRMALGAQPWQVLRSALGQGARLAAMGLALGTLCGMALTRLLATWLYGVSAGDPVTHAGAAALLGGVALVAAFVPARRASRVDPMVALRYE